MKQVTGDVRATGKTPAGARLLQSYPARFAGVVGSVLATLVLRLPFHFLLQGRAAYVSLVPSVIFSAWIAGWAGGLLATVLTAAAAVFLMLMPNHLFDIHNSADVASLVVYGIVGATISWMGHAQRSARSDAEESARQARQSAVVLRKSEARKSAVLEAALDSIVTIDSQGTIVEFNPSAEQTFGYSRDEAVGQPLATTLIPPSLRAEHLHGFKWFTETGEAPILGQRLELTGMRRDGTEFPLEIAIVKTKETGAAEFTAYLRDITERRRSEQELKVRAERESRISRIGEALHSSRDPEELAAIAVHALGAAMEADRCFIVWVDGPAGRAEIARDYYRAGLKPLAGLRVQPALAEALEERLHEGEPLLMPDCAAHPWPEAISAHLAAHQIRSLLCIPFHRDDRLVAVLAVAMAGEPRVWESEDLLLAHAVAAQTRAALDEAQVRHREHNIAMRLQEALQPELPGSVPGLQLAKHYRAALAEAGVGGDFYDCFTVDKGRCALVVGDLSGKGLAAAAQVSIVRNMLRTMLFLGGALDEAVTDLNRIVTINGALNGFATLFVALWESTSQTLTYVNCGQEPALLNRASGAGVERLGPTGPVLGVTEDARFTAGVVSLEPGDTLAVFTDGVTEAGPNWDEMIGIEGVEALLRDAVKPGGSPEATARRMITGLDTRAQNGVRDDVCLLIGVAQRTIEREMRSSGTMSTGRALAS